ncbi:MAG: acetyltransferase [Bacteroidia bacterium]|jgi:sugar O-acyltransferase (sialic acid O-acetyltransferase NeuD family)|nr:acetyltransferase [Bacteroidia bacterium]
MVILGAGGHASEVLDVLLAAKTIASDSILFFDNTPNAHPSKFGYKIINHVQELQEQFKKTPEFIIAVGSPRVRQLLFEIGLQNGGTPFSVISTLSLISTLNVQLGKGLNIMHHAHIFPEVIIEDGVLINAGSYIHHNVCIGQFSEIGPQCVLAGGVRIGKYVQLGAGCIVKPTIQICDDVVIGAGTVVYQNIDEPGTYVGSSLRKLR